MSEKIRTMVLNGTTSAQLRTQAIAEEMTPLMKDGMLKVKTGVTTPAEVLRNAYSIG
jgi:general secretion pathway protein E